MMTLLVMMMIDDDRMMMEITMNILYYTYIIHCICRFVQPTIPPTEAKVSLFEAKKYNAWQWDDDDDDNDNSGGGGVDDDDDAVKNQGEGGSAEVTDEPEYKAAVEI